MLGLVLCLLALTADTTLDQAAKAFEQGRTAEAESTLRALLARQPADVGGLMLMGIVLDAGGRYQEAEGYYKRALNLAPRSPTLLNNLGNHYLASGNPKTAETYFRKVVALEPHHAGANLHLAEMSVAARRGAEAMVFLDRLPAAAQAEPVARLLQAQALALNKRCAEAAPLIADLSNSFSVGLVLAACERYEEAENAFSRALQTDPRNFDILYNLGLAARQAGHLERARQVFEIALEHKPDEPDALYGLSEVLAAQRDNMGAAVLLYRLHRLAPARADAALLLARTTAELGYFEEAASSYAAYLALRPKDDVARREWAFALARAGRAKEALPPLRDFAGKYPRDAVGQYELAVAEASTDGRAALRILDRALALDPDLAPARYARGALHFDQEEFEQAQADFEFLLKRDERSARLLDWIGQIHLRTGRPAEAAAVLKRAVEQAPGDRAVLMHYSRALRELGRDDELAPVLAAFQRAASRQQPRGVPRGFFDFLELKPEEQRRRYWEFLERAATTNAADVVMKVRWAAALWEQGRSEESLARFHEVLQLAPDAAVLGQCGRFLLEHEQYAAAAEFFRLAPESRLDLAIAVFHAGGAEAGLAELEKVPESERQGDYYLLRAQMLDAQGKPEEAARSLNRGIQAAPKRADQYFQAAVFLIKHGRREEAAALLEQATRIVPNAPELRLAHAITLELLQRSQEAEKLLGEIEARWPEWDRPYLIHGIMLESLQRPEEARRMLETAVAMGARDSEAQYYLAWIAGRSALEANQFRSAAEHLGRAVQLQPDSVRARYLLVRAYRELGEEEKSAVQVREIERLQNGASKSGGTEMERLLFRVGKP